VEKSEKHKGEGHRSRLRQRFASGGLDGFQDYEVIELLLTLGTPRKDCKEAAKATLKRFKTLQGVFEASGRELEEIDGIGPKNSLGIKLIKAASDRYLHSRVLDSNPLNNADEVFAYLNHYLRDRTRECFLAIFLDAKNKVLETEVLFEGTLTASAVYPREVVRAALDHHAAALIFAHNHPSGDPSPSREDMTLTRQLINACHIMGLTVHEHLIIGREGYYSFADQGHIARMRNEE
jgi:DNA repair protein RadC